MKKDNKIIQSTKRSTFLAVLLLNTVFALAQERNIFDIARKGTLAEIQDVFKKDPAAVNSVDEKKSSLLILASYRGNTEVALFLVDKTKDIDYNSGMGTALMAAVMSGDAIIVDKLIQSKANLNLADQGGKTALIYATFFNKNELAKMLLQAGGDRNIKDIDGRTALDYAAFNKNTELIILLQK